MHGMSAVKMAGYEAVPDVLQKGLITDIQDSYKGKDENRLIVSVPVTIDGVSYIENVVLRQTIGIQGDYINRLYLHDLALIKQGNNVSTYKDSFLSIEGSLELDNK